MPANLRGVLWITAGTLCFALTDAVVKFLGRDLPPVQMAASRYVIGSILLAPIFIRTGWAALKTTRWATHAMRTILACGAQIGVFYAVVHLMLADATAISFSRSLFMIVLAVFFLGEVVGPRRWVATSVGFAGVLIMTRPGQADFDPISMIAIISALAFAVVMASVRKLASTDSPIQIMFYYQIGSAILFLPALPFFWVAPTLFQWPLLVMIGFLMTEAMVCFTRGYYVGEASILGTIEYTRIVYAVLIGFFLFSEAPDLWTGTGVLIVVGATLYIARHGDRAGPTGG